MNYLFSGIILFLNSQWQALPCAIIALALFRSGVLSDKTRIKAAPAGTFERVPIVVAHSALETVEPRFRTRVEAFLFHYPAVDESRGLHDWLSNQGLSTKCETPDGYRTTLPEQMLWGIRFSFIILSFYWLLCYCICQPWLGLTELKLSIILLWKSRHLPCISTVLSQAKLG